MTDFFRFPQIPHLAWLGSGAPRDDKVLDPVQAGELLAREISVEEKLDGANLGISLDESGRLQIQNRGQYLKPPFRGQFSRLASWLAPHEATVTHALAGGLILFGEWCAARHSIAYDRLPDWFIAFDIYDRRSGRFWSSARRDLWAAKLGLTCPPVLGRGRLSLAMLADLVKHETSRFGREPLEGVIARADSADVLQLRAKLLRPSFVQEMGDHWRARSIGWNAIAAETDA